MINASGVNVERLAEKRGGYRRAFDMPSREAPTPRRPPAHNVIFEAESEFKPKGKIIRVAFLFVEDDFFARCRNFFGKFLARKTGIVFEA